MSTTPCPGCQRPLPADRARSALSRFDNQTRICSSCGVTEGMAQAAAIGAGLDPRAMLESPGRLTPAALVLIDPQ
jgi:hypothetical protein